MKKICMVVPSFKAKGGITSVVSGYRGSMLEEKYKIRYIETYCDGNRISKLIKAIVAYCEFIEVLFSFRPDLIHIHSSFGASFYRKTPFIVLASILKIPVINHIHGSELTRFYQNKSGYTKKCIRFVYKKCSKIIVLSEKWKDSFSEMIDREKMEVVSNFAIFQEQRIEYNLESKGSVLFLGFLTELKGCFDIPKVAALLKKQSGTVSFVLAGSGKTEDIQTIKELSQLNNVENLLLFPGWVEAEQKEKLLQQASVFFLPSYTEGMPMSILEAMGYGLPIVSTTAGGIPELVRNGENGFLFEPGDVQGFAEAIAAILHDSDLREKMSEKSLEIVRGNYTLERHIEALNRIYESLLNEV